MQRKMVCFFVCLFVCFGCWQQSGGCVGRLLSKGRLPSTDTAGKSFHKQRAGATCRNSAVSPDRHLETGHRWSDRRLLDYYNHSYSSAPVSLFLEARSRILGGVCHGCSLTVVWFTSSAWWGFPCLEERSQDVAQNVTSALEQELKVLGFAQ